MRNPINLKMSLSLALLMLFAFCTDDDPIQHELKTTCTPEEAGTLSASPGMYNEGTEIDLKATPAEEYIFKNWSGDASGNENPLKVVMLQDKVITAVFEKVNYTLSIDVIGDGAVNQEVIPAKSTSKDYESGCNVQLTAIADAGWMFVGWTGDYAGTENPTQVKMDHVMSITAKFEKIPYALSIEVEGNGKVDENIILAKSTTDYEPGTKVQLTAVSDEGWMFVKWTGDYTGTENPIQITMSEPMSIVANFELENLEKIYVPDDNFEQALIELGYDQEMDDYVFRYAIETVKELQLENRQIEDLTGIEAFRELNTLILTHNNLTTLDVSNNPYLHTLICNRNQLTSLDISGNIALDPNSFDATDNQLSCVQISPLQLNSGVWYRPLRTGEDGDVDEGVSYSIDCSVSTEDKTYVPDDQFEQTLIDLGVDDVMDNYVKTWDIQHLSELDISGKNISDLTGMEDFQGLLYLYANNNNLEDSLDVSEWANFITLDLRDNPLTCVNVPESWLLNYGGGLSFFFVDEGVDFCNDSVDPRW